VKNGKVMQLHDKRIEPLRALTEIERIRKQLYELTPSIVMGPPRTAADIQEFLECCARHRISVPADTAACIQQTGVFGGIATERLVNIDSQHTISALQHARYMGTCMHTHECFEIICVCYGTAVHRIGDTEMELQAGDFCIMAPEVRHDVSIFSDALVINLQIRKKDFDQTFFKLLLDDDVLARFLREVLYGRSAHPYLLFRTVGSDDLVSLVLDIFEETNQPLDYTNAYRFVCVSKLFLELLRRYRHTICVGELPGGMNVQIVSILQYMQDHYKNATRKTVAEAFHYNESYFSRMFCTATGQSFKKVMTEIRMLKAKQLLSNTSMSISSVAHEIGFHSESNFYRQYRRRFGTTPRAQR